MRDVCSHIIVCGVRIDMVQIPDVLRAVDLWIAQKQRGQYVALTNADSVVLGQRDPALKEATNRSALSVPDGISLVLLGRLHGYGLKRRAYGPDLMDACLKVAEEKGYRNYFYGSTEDTLAKLINNLVKKFPKLVVAGSFSPPFGALSEKDDAAIVATIQKTAPDIVWVGLGCPKQEVWMYAHKDILHVPVMVGVGAAFDFFAGTKPQAPKWIRDHGFEWLFRLLTEPRRLWKRYLLNGPVFVYHVVRHIVKDVVLKKG